MTMQEIAQRAQLARRSFAGPQGLSILSAAMLAGYWFGGEGLLLAAGLAIPGGIAIWDLMSGARGAAGHAGTDGLTGLPLLPAALPRIDAQIAAALRSRRGLAVFLIEADGFAELRRVHGPSGADTLVQRFSERLCGALREDDMALRLDGARFAIVATAMRRPTLEAGIQIAARLLAALAEPVSLNAARVLLTASAGLALLSEGGHEDAATLLAGAGAALAKAQRAGPGTLRVHVPGSAPGLVDRGPLVAEVDEALDSGAIQAWFQPQVSTDTGEITGMEALARWVHPRHGILPPAEFLPAVAAAGRLQRLGTQILSQALAAHAAWQAQGLQVRQVAVNLTAEDLADPALADRIRWELDRLELAPDRLVVEILETVLVPEAGDMVARNISRLAAMGVGLDLDDFGTGAASIAAIRRFDVQRIKIDRSFVTRIDRDRGQQDMVAAILSMADRLGLRTLAEGVETPGEHAMLAQLGCGGVQGFAIAPPLPLADTFGWLLRHAERVAESRALGRKVV